MVWSTGIVGGTGFAILSSISMPSTRNSARNWMELCATLSASEWDGKNAPTGLGGLATHPSVHIQHF
jgi:hypothetical protein